MTVVDPSRVDRRVAVSLPSAHSGPCRARRRARHRAPPESVHAITALQKRPFGLAEGPLSPPKRTAFRNQKLPFCKPKGQRWQTKGQRAARRPRPFCRSRRQKGRGKGRGPVAVQRHRLLSVLMEGQFGRGQVDANHGQTFCLRHVRRGRQLHRQGQGNDAVFEKWFAKEFM